MTKISFQGDYGAFSDEAAKEFVASCETLPYATFEMALEALENGAVDYAAIPIENSIAGRVTDVHRLLKDSGLFIVQEFYLPIRQCLLGLGTTEHITDVYSHVHALDQCGDFIKKRGLTRHVYADTAGSARMVAEVGDITKGAIASAYAAEFYGLTVLVDGIQDNDMNYTRFWLFSREKSVPTYDETKQYKTTLRFTTKDSPASLYKALGAFATPQISMSRLESLTAQTIHNNATFCVDIDVHPDAALVQGALNELRFHCVENSVKILGVYDNNKPIFDKIRRPTIDHRLTVHPQ